MPTDMELYTPKFFDLDGTQCPDCLTIYPRIPNEDQLSYCECNNTKTPLVDIMFLISYRDE